MLALPDVADQDAQGHADEDSHAYGDGGELDVFQEQEKICALLSTK